MTLMAPVVSAPPPARAGLANELMPLAKAYLASQALSIPLVSPAWGMDRRPYWRHFSGSRLDVATYAAETAFRRPLRFTEEAYRKTGIVDYGPAVRRWYAAQQSPRQRAVVVNEGMWGGFLAIDAARPFIRAYLAGSRHAARNIAALRARRRAGTRLVAIHIRGGDFLLPSSVAAYRHAWNLALPPEWYAAVCRGLRQLSADTVQFLLVGDAASSLARGLVDEFDALTTCGESHTDVSDLVLLSTADVLVCSISSYSLMAAWLGDAPYVWPAEQLHNQDGWLSLWGMESAQRVGLTAANREALTFSSGTPAGRGVPVPLSGVLPRELAAALRQRTTAWDRRADLLYYGVVREPLSTA